MGSIRIVNPSRQLKDVAEFSNSLQQAFALGLHRGMVPQVTAGPETITDRIEAFIKFVVSGCNTNDRQALRGVVLYLADGSAITIHTMEGVVTFLMPEWLQHYFKVGYWPT